MAAEAVFHSFSLQASGPHGIAGWQQLSLIPRSLGPGIWLLFSLTYSRGNYWEFLHRWRLPLIALAFLPLFVCLATVYGIHFVSLQRVVDSGGAEVWRLNVSGAGKILNALFLVAIVIILTNLERTFRSAVGTMRWQIKFLVIGLWIIFGVRFYTRSQVLIFSSYDLGLANIEIAALLIGCFLMAAAYIRSGFSEIDVYPSRVVLQTSVTVVLAGSYLFVVGVLARVLAHFGQAANLPTQAFLVLLALAALAVLLLSERFRHNVRLFVSRHFRRPQHDFRQIWTRFTQSLSAVLDETNLCLASAQLVSEIFSALSVSVWLLDERGQRLDCIASTTGSGNESPESSSVEMSIEELRSLPVFNDTKPVDLERVEKRWRKEIQEIGAGRFRVGQRRIGIPLRAADQPLGVLIVADRVNGVPYSAEEMDLLRCIGESVAGGLLNLRLTRETLERKELEAFQTMSTFFIHDLKNAASTLGLTLQNLPEHFDDPAFREDALRGITVAAERINHIISRLSAFRHELRPRPVKIDLNALVSEVLKTLNGSSSAKIVTKLDPLPPIMADREQMGSIIMNLVINARDAVGSNGCITIETKPNGEWVTLSVSDNGCGMTPDFVKNSLFRPFHTTKKQGLGVGMFQTKMMIEANSGSIQVTSKTGSGTTFRITLPTSAK